MKPNSACYDEDTANSPSKLQERLLQSQSDLFECQQHRNKTLSAENRMLKQHYEAREAAFEDRIRSLEARMSSPELLMPLVNDMKKEMRDTMIQPLRDEVEEHRHKTESMLENLKDRIQTLKQTVSSQHQYLINRVEGLKAYLKSDSERQSRLNENTSERLENVCSAVQFIQSNDTVIADVQKQVKSQASSYKVLEQKTSTQLSQITDQSKERDTHTTSELKTQQQLIATLTKKLDQLSGMVHSGRSNSSILTGLQSQFTSLQSRVDSKLATSKDLDVTAAGLKEELTKIKSRLQSETHSWQDAVRQVNDTIQLFEESMKANKANIEGQVNTEARQMREQMRQTELWAHDQHESIRKDVDQLSKTVKEIQTSRINDGRATHTNTGQNVATPPKPDNKTAPSTRFSRSIKSFVQDEKQVNLHNRLFQFEYFNQMKSNPTETHQFLHNKALSWYKEQCSYGILQDSGQRFRLEKQGNILTDIQLVSDMVLQDRALERIFQEIYGVSILEARDYVSNRKVRKILNMRGTLSFDRSLLNFNDWERYNRENVLKCIEWTVARFKDVLDGNFKEMNSRGKPFDEFMESLCKIQLDMANENAALVQIQIAEVWTCFSDEIAG